MVCSTQNIYAQSEPKSVTKRKKQLERQEEDKKKRGEKAHEKGIEKHKKIQTKETRKRMKQSQKKSNRVNNNRKEFFLKRWFSANYSEKKIFFAVRQVNCKLPD
jgi:hypothetical protein